MTRNSRGLTRGQLAVIEMICDGMPLEEVAQKRKVGIPILRRWMREEEFVRELWLRVESAKDQSRLLMAKYLPVATAKLINLTESRSSEVARKACLDLLSLCREGEIRIDTRQEEGNFSEKTAGVLLRVLARSRKKKTSKV